VTFQQDILDLLTGARVAHVGMHHYADHAGVRDGKSTSGAKLWIELDAAREAQAIGGMANLVGAEYDLLREASSEIYKYIPAGIRVVELGPGTLSAFKKKTLPIIKALQSAECTIVDGSSAFLGEISASADLHGLDIKPIMDDFFSVDHPYRNDGEPNLFCVFGSTVSNIISPFSDELPKNALIESLRSLSHVTKEGWLLITFDADQDGKRIESYYEAHKLFQLNIFDRINVELPVDARFDPKAFDYEAEWRSHSSQLGHMAIVTRDLQFSVDNTDISLSRGKKLYMKNSYKFMPDFFEKCCKLAGLEL
jgi:uncharacterized SAM-dependent methyltransferase